MFDQRIQGLYAITPNKNIDIDFIENIITSQQVTILQYRHKILDQQIKLNEAQKLRELCLTHHTLFIVNDDINLCEKVNADGIHLGRYDDSIAEARRQLGAKSIIQKNSIERIYYFLQKTHGLIQFIGIRLVVMMFFPFSNCFVNPFFLSI